MIPRSEARQLDGIVRAALHDVLRELLAPIVETPAFEERLAMAIAARSAPAGPVAAPLPAEAPPAALPKLKRRIAGHTTQDGVRRGYTKDEIAAAGAAYQRLGSAAKAGAAVGVHEMTIRKWKRQHGWATSEQAPGALDTAPAAPQADPISAPAASAEPKTAAPPPVALIPSWAKPRSAASLPSIVAPADPETQAASTKEVRAWLERSLVQAGVGKLPASDKVAAMTHQEALQEANRRRQLLRLVPFVFIGTKVPA